MRSPGPETLDWTGPQSPEADRVRRREFLDLPERW